MPKEAFFRLQAAFLCSCQSDCGLWADRVTVRWGIMFIKIKNLSYDCFWEFGLCTAQHLQVIMGGNLCKKHMNVMVRFPVFAAQVSPLSWISCEGESSSLQSTIHSWGPGLLGSFKLPMTLTHYREPVGSGLWLFKAFLRVPYHRNCTGIGNGSRISQKAQRLEERPTILLIP